jgi:hypothetical protein
MSFHSRSFHRTLTPLFLLAALLTPFPLAAWPAYAPFGETIESFIRNAYAGVGIGPSCQQVRGENETQEGLLPATSAQFEAEARHFVSTLIETENSYTHYSPFEETAYYSSRYQIPNPSLNHQSTQAYVIDLYHAFLQRDPDLNGLFYWTDRADDYCSEFENHTPPCIDQGKEQTRAVLDAFGIIPDDAEFTQLVHSLVDGGPICCPVICQQGRHYDCDLNECVNDNECFRGICEY